MSSEITMSNQLMTLEEVKEYLQIDLSTVYRYINREENPLPSYKISRNNIRVRKDELENWVNNYLKVKEEVK